jgi:uncharacterized protein (DUF885 family)
MTKFRVAAALLIAFLFSMGVETLRSPAVAAPRDRASAQFAKLVDDYFDFYFQYHPSDATAAGFHQYDNQLEDFSRPAVEAEAAKLKDWQGRFKKVNPAKLSLQDADDLALLESTIKSRRLDLESIAMWRKDPDLYTSGVTDGIYSIIKRTFAPAEDRLRSVIARERQIPAALEAARHNLDNPPRVYTEIALEQLPGAVEFFQQDVPEAFEGVHDAALLAEFHASNAAAVSALEKYLEFVRDDLLPASHGDFRIGPEDFRKKLLYDEMVEIPLDQLLKIGYADLRRNQGRLKETAAAIDPKKSPRDVLAALEKDHPAPNRLLQSFRDVLGSLRRFIEEKHIVAIPSQILPIVEDTPAFMSATTTASMDTPGPYETRATEALFNVTLPDPDWTARKVEEWMEGFSRGTIVSTAVHEVYPGHYTQFLWAKRFPSKVRKLIDVGTNVEGWAHYTEEMMLDEGYGGGDPKLRMGQLQDALLRDARFIVGIEMHTGQMTLAQAKEFFVREGCQVPPVAEAEAKRGTGDPTYLVYTLGKLQILKLRADYQKKEGAKFSLQDFHDRFMMTGGIPLKLVRKEMLGDDGPTL